MSQFKVNKSSGKVKFKDLKIKREKLTSILCRDKRVVFAKFRKIKKSLKPSLPVEGGSSRKKVSRRDRFKQLRFIPSLYTKRVAEFYIRNGVVMVDKLKSLQNPKKVVSYPSDEDFSYRLKAGLTDLSTDKFNLLKSTSRKGPFKTSLRLPVKGDLLQSSERSKGKSYYYKKPISKEEEGDLLSLKGKRRVNFYQKNFYLDKNIRSFYNLKKYDWEGRGSSDNSLKEVERRLDILLLRLGFARNLHVSRELIKKGSVLVDGRVANSAKLIIDPISTIKVVSDKTPFDLLFRYHLRNFPRMKFDIRRGKRRLRRSRRRGAKKLKMKFFKNESTFLLKSGSSIKSKASLLEASPLGKALIPKVSKSDRRGYNLRSELYSKLRFKLRKKTLKGLLIRKFKKLRRRLSMRNSTFSYPMTELGKQLLYVDLNKVLVTKFYKKKDVIVPYSIH
jgi:ribosomal protein S4